METKENNYTKIYIEILRYGRENNGLSYQDLINHLNENNLLFFENQSVSPYTTLFENIVTNSFQTLDGDLVNRDTQGFIYLKPEALSVLINYEATEQAREISIHANKISTKALTIARWSLWVSGFLALASIVIELLKC